jgi:hypothetical protein
MKRSFLIMQNNNEAMPAPLEPIVILGFVERLLVTGKVSPDMLPWLAGLKQQLLTETVDLAFPDPTPAEEIEFIDRIISGLPANAVVVRPHDWHEGIADVIFPTGVKLYDVASKHPKEFFSDWYRVPAYDNYEINSAGEVRNRWTRRVLEVAEQGGEQYVEMHDKEGFAHDINVRYIKEQVFGN